MVGDTTTGGTTTSSGSSSPLRPSPPLEAPKEEITFNQEQCLFCNKLFGNFDANVAHMQTAHGLFIPREHLTVDLEILLAYLHLVIFGYNECISCGTQRNSTLAVQQHMLGKSHCMIDVASGDSEYADFYDFTGQRTDSGDEEEEEEEDVAVPSKGKAEGLPMQADENSLRLPSGRIISSRSQSHSHARRQRNARTPSPTASERLEDAPAPGRPDAHRQAPASPTPGEPSGSTALSTARSERHEAKFSKQLATLRANDERSLAHLSLPEQRAVLATTQKQVDKARRVEERYRTRLEGLGNKFLMTHFVKDAADKRTLWK